MNLSINLLRYIGSPFNPESEVTLRCHNEFIFENASFELLEIATKNRMPLFFLTALKKRNELAKLKLMYDRMNEESINSFDAMSRVSNILCNKGIENVIFKTIRPYPATTVDIDVIILKSKKEYIRSRDILINHGYESVGFKQDAETFRDPHININVDLYPEITVSKIIYLDKEKLTSYMIEKVLPNEKSVVTLNPHADLICLIAHSIIKEQMYTLSEYYSTLYFLSQTKLSEIKKFVDMIHENSIINAAQAHISITAKLHEVAHNFIPEKIVKIIDDIDMNKIELKNIEKNYRTPHKFHPLTVGTCLLEKMAKEEVARKSLAKQLLSMTNFNFSKDFLNKIIKNVRRESY
ncbi:MAG: hypothetical protein ACFFDT_25430 [Candidatus Hodarchaeota archaeon]